MYERVPFQPLRHLVDYVHREYAEGLPGYELHIAKANELHVIVGIEHSDGSMFRVTYDLNRDDLGRTCEHLDDSVLSFPIPCDAIADAPRADFGPWRCREHAIR